ncbi:MAG TPA: amino acid adenylation domain-containing protein [Acidimicrobiales bacterium]|nr:amino acid adenylation domain-containing protein [Acidimicrobiales bacterium]
MTSRLVRSVPDVDATVPGGEFSTAHQGSPSTESVLGLLDHHARSRPDAAALVSGSRRLSFSELVTSAAAIGASLREHGAQADVCVGLLAEPGLALVEGVWGILASGAAYLPLSPEYPRQRLRFMMELAGVRTVLTNAQTRALALGTVPDGTTVLSIEEARRDGEGGRFAAAAPSDLAYVIFTSGSTGRPKGVMIEHRGIANQMRWLGVEQSLGPGARILQKTPFSFDAAQWEILSPACGATVVCAPAGAHREPELIAACVSDHGVTHLQCVPTLWDALVEDGGLRLCWSLRRLFSGGEALSTPLARRLLEAVPRAALTNLYGPTETTINATAYRVRLEDLLGSEPVPIGRPVANTGVVVMGPGMQETALGEVGEICITGVQVGRGYLNDDNLSAGGFTLWERPGRGPSRLYCTGDMGYVDRHGQLVYCGRRDHQVKVRGHRIELGEVKTAIEQHRWIRQAAVVPWTAKHGSVNLAAVITLDPEEAALMDQGVHGTHHQSKAGRLQVRAQLSKPGQRSTEELTGLPVVALPRACADGEQVLLAFRRKTYRYFEDIGPTREELVQLCLDAAQSWPQKASPSQPMTSPSMTRPLGLADLGRMLRWFGPFQSSERLLPKYTYASPGALYATQIYIEVDRAVPGLAPGIHYFHPERHELYHVAGADRIAGRRGSGCRVHFVGRRGAIRDVYTTNIDEVLHLEAGHMLAVLEKAVPGGAGDLHLLDAELPLSQFGLDNDHVHLLTVQLGHSTRGRPLPEPVTYVQAMSPRTPGFREGLYRFIGDDLIWESADVIERRHVIAINQAVYERATFAMTWSVPVATGWSGFVALGRALQMFQMNERGFGAMSSGYASLTGRPLPAARRLDEILGRPSLSYFAVAGRVGARQLESRGMEEDVVHMRGPAEMLRDDLAEVLPEHMVPSRVLVVDEIPVNNHGKVDLAAVRTLVENHQAQRPFIAPATPLERRLSDIWSELLDLERVSVTDDFFECGGDSLVAVVLTNRLNDHLGARLPVQAVFEVPTIAKMAARIEAGSYRPASRLVELAKGCDAFTHGGGSRHLPTVFVWPGLGGFPMGLRSFAEQLCGQHLRGGTVVGVQSCGLNPGERPYASLKEMVDADADIVTIAAAGSPLYLIGYSFGARLAFEVAREVERRGHLVQGLVLVAPGQPGIPQSLLGANGHADPMGAPNVASVPARHRAEFSDPRFVAVALSVFAGRIDEGLVRQAMARVGDEQSFVAFASEVFHDLDTEFIRRVVRLVVVTSALSKEPPGDAATLGVRADVVRARGDAASFVEGLPDVGLVTEVRADHYSSTRSLEGIDELCSVIGPLLRRGVR